MPARCVSTWRNVIRCLPCCAELGQVARDRIVEVQQPALIAQVHQHRGHHLRRREQVEQRRAASAITVCASGGSYGALPERDRASDRARPGRAGGCTARALDTARCDTSRVHACQIASIVLRSSPTRARVDLGPAIGDLLGRRRSHQRLEVRPRQGHRAESITNAVLSQSAMGARQNLDEIRAAVRAQGPARDAVADSPCSSCCAPRTLRCRTVTSPIGSPRRPGIARRSTATSRISPRSASCAAPTSATTCGGSRRLSDEHEAARTRTSSAPSAAPSSASRDRARHPPLEGATRRQAAPGRGPRARPLRRLHLTTSRRGYSSLPCEQYDE